MSNALVAIVPTEHTDANLRATNRPHADFIAHLIATSDQAPQTRARRRAEPSAAIAVYGAVSQWPIVSGRKLSLLL